jgi:hypothetical protein
VRRGGGGCVAAGVRHDLRSPVMPAEGRNLKEGVSTQTKFLCLSAPASCLARRAEARRVRSRARCSCAFIAAQRRPLTGSDRFCHKAA